MREGRGWGVGRRSCTSNRVYRVEELVRTEGGRKRRRGSHDHEADLFEQERRRSEGEGPAVVVVEELLRLPGPVHHLIVDAGDVENQPHHQTET